MTTRCMNSDAVSKHISSPLNLYFLMLPPYYSSYVKPSLFKMKPYLAFACGAVFDFTVVA